MIHRRPRRVMYTPLAVCIFRWEPRQRGSDIFELSRRNIISVLCPKLGSFVRTEIGQGRNRADKHYPDPFMEQGYFGEIVLC